MRKHRRRKGEDRPGRVANAGVSRDREGGVTRHFLRPSAELPPCPPILRRGSTGSRRCPRRARDESPGRSATERRGERAHHAHRGRQEGPGRAGRCSSRPVSRVVGVVVPSCRPARPSTPSILERQPRTERAHTPATVPSPPKSWRIGACNTPTPSRVEENALRRARLQLRVARPHRELHQERAGDNLRALLLEQARRFLLALAACAFRRRRAWSRLLGIGGAENGAWMTHALPDTDPAKTCDQ